ncbi:MAG: trypsin-like peptidase domain-containing protein [Acidimicrobiia bacterium]|nr:trypsin-like peptidase domain-containing protein [Acidimicrobiia bacterium]
MTQRPRRSTSTIRSARFVALSLGFVLVLAGCGGGSVFDAATTTTAPSSTTLLEATSTAAVSPSSGVVLYDVSELVKEVRPGVVAVTETGVTYDMFRRRVETEGQGTGIVIDDQGHILTNYHVISGAESVSVYAEDGRERPARVIFGDPATDIALLEVEDTEGLVPLVFGDSDAMEVGDPVIAMGNALGLDATSPTVSVGIVSALGRSIETSQATLEDLIQTDAAINSGNSGGPLLNAAGEVVGINTAIASGAENIGFSIAVNSVKGEVSRALAGLGVPFVGVTTMANSPELAQRYRLAASEGLVVTSVLPTGPASEAGLQAGDIILAVDGTAVVAEEDLEAAVAAAGAGQTVTLTIVRGRQSGDVEVVVAER